MKKAGKGREGAIRNSPEVCTGVVRLISLAEYAKRRGIAVSSVRRKCLIGDIEGAIKIGRNWCLPDNAPYVDNRITHGKYVNWRKDHNGNNE